PVRIVATTSFDSGSIRDTVEPSKWATHTAPAAAMSPSGPFPTFTVAATVPASGSSTEGDSEGEGGSLDTDGVGTGVVAGDAGGRAELVPPPLPPPPPHAADSNSAVANASVAR